MTKRPNRLIPSTRLIPCATMRETPGTPPITVKGEHWITGLAKQGWETEEVEGRPEALERMITEAGWDEERTS